MSTISSSEFVLSAERGAVELVATQNSMGCCTQVRWEERVLREQY